MCGVQVGEASFEMNPTVLSAESTRLGRAQCKASSGGAQVRSLGLGARDPGSWLCHCVTFDKLLLLSELLFPLLQNGDDNWTYLIRWL